MKRVFKVKISCKGKHSLLIWWSVVAAAAVWEKGFPPSAEHSLSSGHDSAQLAVQADAAIAGFRASSRHCWHSENLIAQISSASCVLPPLDWPLSWIFALLSRSEHLVPRAPLFIAGHVHGSKRSRILSSWDRLALPIPDSSSSIKSLVAQMSRAAFGKVRMMTCGEPFAFSFAQEDSASSTAQKGPFEQSRKISWCCWWADCSSNHHCCPWSVPQRLFPF